MLAKTILLIRHKNMQPGPNILRIGVSFLDIQVNLLFRYAELAIFH